MALTLTQTWFQSGDRYILIVFSDNHGKKKREVVRTCDLVPASVLKVQSNPKVVVLYGERKGQIFEVCSTNKRQQICKLHLENHKKCKEQ